MKNIARLIVALLLLLGTTSTIALADGPWPAPTCNPWGGNCVQSNR